MKNQYLKILLLCGLVLAFATVSFAQKKKPKPNPRMIQSEDFKTPVPNNTVRNNRVKKGKKWRKRCRYEYFKRKGRMMRVYRCRSVKY
ncbi:MAG TPA: hypothetical protein VNB22_12760 [Pyrinomonadaceae bacterium]|nr:hypothetical protein [Pyrinomonadaceae bacterium]